MSHISHTPLASTRDYMTASSKGDLVDPANKTFESDPMLLPIKTSQLPHKILPDPSPSTDPELFDKSTSHPNTHYHHEKQLSKKKRAKKYGTGPAVAMKGGNRAVNVLSDNQHSREKIDHDKRRDLTFEERDLMAHKEHPKEGEDEEEGEGGEEDESEDEDELTQSAQQHSSNRLVGHEHEKGQGVHDKHPVHVEHAFEAEKKPKHKEEKATVDEAMEKGATPSLLARATNLASSLTSKVTETLTAAKDKIVGKGGDDKGDESAESEETEKSSGDDSNKDSEAEKAAE